MLNWHPYNQFDWENSAQTQFTPPEKNEFERLAAKILWVPGVEMNDCWGTVHPPGRNAVVIQVHPHVRHRFERNGIRQVGLKIYNQVDGKVMWPSVSKFHAAQREKLPGLPNAHVQEVLDYGVIQDDHGTERGYLVQQWVEGVVLEERIKGDLTADEVLQIADDLFQEIIIPLWAKGSSWWDVRASNYVVTPDGRLMMIDSDTVGAYADEILQTPQVFTKRNRGSRTAMKRYAGLLARMAGRLAPRGEKSEWTQQNRALFQRHLAPVFVAPYPLPRGWKKSATKAWLNFRADYTALLHQPNIQPASPK